LEPADFGIGRLFWSIQEAIVLGEAGSGRIVLWNPAAERLFGYAADEIVGRSIELLVPEPLREQHRAGIARYTQTGHGPLIDGGKPVEVPAVRKNGEQILIELSLSRLDDVTPEGHYVLAIIRDVSERRSADELRARRARHLALSADIRAALAEGRQLRDMLQRCAEAMVRHLEAAFARIWTLNEAEQVLELQASAGLYTHLDGPHGKVQVGRFKIGLIAEERAPHLTNDVLGDPRVGDQEWARREGMVAFAGYPLLVDGRAIGVMAMFARQRLEDDLLESLAVMADAIAQGVERIRAEQALAQRAAELARSNAELEQFAYVASHDLQEPLRAVVSYVQLLEKRYRGQLDERADRSIGHAVDGARRMQTLISDLLAFSRVERRGAPFGPTDTEAVLGAVLENLRPAIEESGAVVTHDPLPPLVADRTQLVQLFQNLIGNAIKFRADAPPRVHLSAEPDQETGGWRFAVRDHGIGISPEYHDRIFLIFQRLHGRNEYPGTGIGLAVCKRIVERHGGRIWLESSGDNAGSTFYFTIPNQDGEPAS
jgi:PAS domain S-box-containing protein